MGAGQAGRWSSRCGAWLLVALATGCGAHLHGAPPRSAAAAPRGAVEVASRAEMPAGLAELMLDITPPAEGLPAGFAPFDGALACDPLGPGEELIDWYERCGIGTTMAYDADRGLWVVLAVDRGEGGPEAFTLHEATAAGSREVFSGPVEPAAIDSLRSRLAPLGALPAPTNIVTSCALAEYSLGAYVPLVGLGGPLEGWLLYLETTEDLDRPEHVLWLVSSDGARRHELGRRPAQTGPCDGGGYHCEATDSECSAAELRAEGRLCVEPAGIELVAVADDALALLGGIVVAGHGGYPSFFWVVALPSELDRQ